MQLGRKHFCLHGAKLLWGSYSLVSHPGSHLLNSLEQTLEVKTWQGGLETPSHCHHAVLKIKLGVRLAKPCEQIEIRHPGVMPAGPEMVPLYTATELFTCHRDHKQLGQRAGKGWSLEVFQPSLFARLL